MEKKIIMKTNVDKTATGVKIIAPPKAAKAFDRILAGVIDIGLIHVAATLSMIFFKLRLDDFGADPLIRKILVYFYFYLILCIFPNTLFSQSVGKFLMKLKIVKQENYRRLSLFKTFFRDVWYRPLVLLMPWTLGNSEGQAVHDKLAGSMVVVAK
jgi:uncharacterized RDD family membrane protein YckC